MLLELSVKNLAVIEEIRVSFRTGFHVLTGETGAGKSILIDALSLAIGGRASADLVRHGCSAASIEALFDVPGDHPSRALLASFGIDAESGEPLIIRREVTAAGKSTARVNGQLIALQALRAVGETLVNIHGQHEHQSLLRVDRHLEWLDVFGGARVASARQAYRELYEQYAETRKLLSQLQRTGKEALQLADLYRFQWEEISAANLAAGEDELLREEKSRLANSEKLFSAANDAYEALYGGKAGLETVAFAIQRMGEIVKYDPAQQALLDQVQSAYYQLEDAAYQLRGYRDGIEFNPERLEEIERRLQTVHSLKRKYGETVEDILAHAEKIKSELDGIDHQEERIAELEDALASLTARLRAAAEQLTAARRDAADKLAAELAEHLKDLHMEKTRFHVEMRSGEDVGFRPDGWDEAEFLISPNPGEPLRGLAKIASGGELSRIMLAMKSIFAAADRVPSLIFDEVDTGVSGRAAQAIAEKMARLAADVQVFAITHLPQVACMADEHYAIVKKVREERTFTEVHELSGEERTEELARMLGGARVTDTTLRHAGEMIALAAERKAAWQMAGQESFPSLKRMGQG